MDGVVVALSVVELSGIACTAVGESSLSTVAVAKDTWLAFAVESTASADAVPCSMVPKSELNNSVLTPAKAVPEVFSPFDPEFARKPGGCTPSGNEPFKGKLEIIGLCARLSECVVIPSMLPKAWLTVEPPRVGVSVCIKLIAELV
ncbi:hypothetical protein [Endozoicomonas sp. ONNA2]|uniref:hypothetical protein n=1 Tax=Endozoicomonas sp. ONNA2 TaxID=2828741 RepID=UPI0021474460|nr:hypothetical protein [Endozoicomonas sp. ONNA2]